MTLNPYELPHRNSRYLKVFPSKYINSSIRKLDLSAANCIVFLIDSLGYFTHSTFPDQWLLQPLSIPKPESLAAFSSHLIAIKTLHFIQLVSSMDWCF